VEPAARLNLAVSFEPPNMQRSCRGVFFRGLLIVCRFFSDSLSALFEAMSPVSYTTWWASPVVVKNLQSIFPRYNEILLDLVLPRVPCPKY
jgi:hypothetical protein